MVIQKLSWASVVVKGKESSLLIDPLGATPSNQDKPLVARVGEAREEIFPLTQIARPSAILVTHVHADHFDAKSVQEAFGFDIPLYVPKESVDMVARLGFSQVVGVQVGDVIPIDEFQVTATYSLDGYGTPQVAWMVQDGHHKMIHAGDTMWHGLWWRMLAQFGSIDVACLPVNGAVLKVAGLPNQTDHPACLTPEEAVEAAHLLGAKKLVPIHFGTFHNPPYYVETENVVGRLQEQATKRNLDVQILQAGEKLHLL